MGFWRDLYDAVFAPVEVFDKVSAVHGTNSGGGDCEPLYDPGVMPLEPISSTAAFPDDTEFAEQTYVNPATGMVMVGGMSGVDTSGNPFGVDLHSSFDCGHSMFDN